MANTKATTDESNNPVHLATDTAEGHVVTACGKWAAKTPVPRSTTFRAAVTCVECAEWDQAWAYAVSSR
jgi:hypothetical protein